MNKTNKRIVLILMTFFILLCTCTNFSATAAESLTNVQAGTTTPMYRLYNPNSGEHFYSGSTEESDDLTAAGWLYEGVAWNAPIYSGQPVYRMYNPNSGDHHYTMSQEEVDMLKGAGWLYEGVAWNSAPIATCTIPQYRLYNPNADIGSHHYTGSIDERDFLVSVGWIYEGIGWYGVNAHTYVAEVTAPTCIEKGYTTFRCDCGECYIGNEKEALGHDYEEIIVEPNCTEDGYTLKECKRCSDKNKSNVVVALGHRYADTTVASTCTEKGYTLFTCECGESYIENVTEALGHDYEEIIVEPNCTEDGYTLKECKRCSDKNKSNVVVALGHLYQSTSVEATCTEKGYTAHTCLNCNDIYIDGVVEELGHVLEGSIFIQQNSSDEKGNFVKECSVCGQIVLIDTGNSKYGYYAFAKESNGNAMQEFYVNLYNTCYDFSFNDQDLADLTIAEMEFEKYGLTVDEAISVFKIFAVENPSYYWLSNSVTVVGDCSFYILIDEEYAKASYRRECDAAIRAMEEACSNILDNSMTDLEKALAIHDFILKRMNYAYESDGVTPSDAVWAHNMIGCAKEGLGVCESYAEAYMYLCLLNNIECIPVTGMAGNEQCGYENHEWNLIFLDGKWYAVDITWDETNRVDEAAYNFFGLSDTAIDWNHDAAISGGYGVDYFYELPEISERSIELVKLYKDNVFVDTYINIDEAFESMTDSQGGYRIELYDYMVGCIGYESAGFMITTPENIIHRIQSNETPMVGELTIAGHSMDEYVFSTEVDIERDLLLNSNIVIENVNLSQNAYVDNRGSLNLQSYSITTVGKYCSIGVPIKGSMDENGSSVHARAQETEIWDMICVNSLLMEGYTRVVGELTVNYATNPHSCSNFAVSMVNEIPHESRIRNLYGDILIEKQNTVTIEHILEADTHIWLRFGKEEEYPVLEIQEMVGPIQVYLDGKIFYFSYDIEGNYKEWIEEISPYDLLKPIAYLKNPDDFNRLTIHHDGEGEITHLYDINSEGAIYLKEN